ncbi:DVU_1555 family C-GCAxxG-C-C protein [Sporomusa sp. KB1]|uniref:DVU_1555 family C-GCAxxG-C-C protein n=1 Tax=Sporomusa sp. KB1 TaxID=943346 RepID=UPI0011A25486|nr:DV_1555 family C-GCAxxG-C-C protein [Sporomusa sp. KB1]TWH48732.1 putative redox-active protein with C_GCAxxG_C_C motif [Sporomusa sp. KB1]
MDVNNADYFHLLKLAHQELSCSQILLQMRLNDQGRENPELIRAMAGLVGGLGYCGKICGALTSGACLLALYAGKGSTEEVEDSRLNAMIEELVKWFEQEVGSQYGGTDCNIILEGNLQNRIQRCPQILLQTNQKVKEILEANGYDLLSGKLEA